MRSARLLAFVIVFALPLTALTKQFPDVKADYLYRVQVEKLSDSDVIGGHPDGSFKPYDLVDRAAMLKMLYKAARLTPDPKTKKGFNDVQPGSWYEAYVYDAYERGFVKGYDGKLFKPGQPVSRDEALKLTIVILGIPLVDDSSSITVYTDVPASAWSLPYVRTALARGILPIPGQEGPTYKPGAPMTRGEAAAYIWYGMHPQDRTTSHVASSAAASSAAPSPTTGASSSARKRVDDPVSTDEITQQTVPFTDARVLGNKQPLSYRFRVSSSTILDASITIDPSDGGKITCTLYRLEPSSISDEYYLGMQEEKGCFLRAALTAGDYQLQVQPTVAGSHVNVDARWGEGDSNDGFSQAKTLLRGTLQTDLLDSNDLGDWFTFTVGQSTSLTPTPGTNLSVMLTSGTNLGCIVYARSDVDLFGFSGPQCNQAYLYPQGTYMVNVRHAAPRAAKQTYTIELK